MKKELLIHFFALVVFFLFLSLLKGWLSVSYAVLWIGGVVGTLLPDIDHIIYIYFFGQQELTSQRVGYKLQKRDLWGTLNLLADTRSERKKLIFHTASFQVIFLVLTFFIISSSGSVFGNGLVLAFSLHLFIDQIVDMMQTDSLANWFNPLKLVLDKQKASLYLVSILAMILFLGFLT